MKGHYSIETHEGARTNQQGDVSSTLKKSVNPGYVRLTVDCFRPLVCFFRELTYVCGLGQWSPTFLSPETSFVGDNFSMDPGWGDGVGGDGFRMIQSRYIYCALYFYYYYIVIYNEIIIQLTIMQNQWEP